MSSKMNFNNISTEDEFDIQFEHINNLNKEKRKKEDKENMKATGIITLTVIAILVLIVGGFMYGIPTYNVWQQEMSGKAEMARAEQNRRILVEEAKAKLEAEKLNAEAEYERAKGMKKAMEEENGTLTSTYNQYLFIRTLEKLADKGSLPQIIYVPSEGLTPVMDINKK